MTGRVPPLAFLAFGAASVALGGCAGGREVTEERGSPVYHGVSTIFLADDLVSFTVEMRNAPDDAAVETYGRCAAARHAVDDGYGYARQVRTIVTRRGSSWFGDAVYLMSVGRPEGDMVIDARLTAASCFALGIPAA